MKNLLLIMGNHSPNPSSVANCMEPLIKKMSKEFNVDIITNRRNIYASKYEIRNEINIYRIDDHRIINTNLLNKIQKFNSNTRLKYIILFLTTILKIVFYLRFVLFSKEKRTAGWRVKEVLDKCLKLHKKNKYDIVLSISQPFKSHYFAEKFVESIDDNIKWYIYEFDPYSFNDGLTKNKFMKKIYFKNEYRIFEKSDKIFLTPELYKFYKKTKFKEFYNKVVSMPFANIEPLKYNLENVSNYNILDSKKANLLFAGRLYKNIRNPKSVLDFFSKVNKDFNIVFMTNWSKKNFSKCKSENIKIVEFQNRDTALYTIENTEFLINIGNTVSFQIPAKIFEYMSSGKPIIHFSKIKNGPALKYLKKYPKAFIINENSISDKVVIKRFEKFYEKNKNSSIEFVNLKDESTFFNKGKILDYFMKEINK